MGILGGGFEEFYVLSWSVRDFGNKQSHSHVRTFV